MLTTILNNIGLSPTTIGITGLESIIAIAESQQEREKVSLEEQEKQRLNYGNLFYQKVSIGLLMVYEYIDNLIGISKELRT